MQQPPKKGADVPLLIIELKWDKSKDGAIRQIRDRQYPEVLEGYGGEMLLVGVNYNAKTQEHECRIERGWK